MKLSTQQHDLDSSPGKSFNGSFRKSRSGDADTSANSTSGISTSSRFIPTSVRVFKGLKHCAKKLVDLKIFIQGLEDWVWKNLHADYATGEQSFESPFLIDELRKLDVALEGVLFQQLLRMPCRPYASDDIKEDEYLALEDFLHSIVYGLWRTFWHKSGPLPFFVSCPRYPGSKFYTVEKAISRGRLEGLRGAALISNTGRNLQVHWDQVVLFALFKPNILLGDELVFSSRTICEALFYGFHILLSRSLSNYNTLSSDSVFIIVLDSKFGGVVKFGGDLGKLELNSSNPYQSGPALLTNF